MPNMAKFIDILGICQHVAKYCKLLESPLAHTVMFGAQINMING